MNTLLKAYQVPFNSDGTSTTMELDASVVPVGEDFRGNIPTGVSQPAVTSVFTGNVTGVSASIEGTTITITFASPLPQFDAGNNLVIYSLSFFLQYAD